MKMSKMLSVLVLISAAVGLNAVAYAADRTTGLYMSLHRDYIMILSVLTDVPQKGNFQ